MPSWPTITASASVASELRGHNLHRRRSALGYLSPINDEEAAVCSRFGTKSVTVYEAEQDQGSRGGEAPVNHPGILGGSIL